MSATGAPDLPDRAAYLARWSELHGGFDPASSAWVKGWLSLAYALARPCARRGLSPHLVTLLGVALGIAVPVAAGVGGRWLLLGAAATVGVGLADGLDGAVAVLSGRVSRTGAVLDAVADRVTDLAFVTALWAAGAPGPLCAAVGSLTLVSEYARARAGAAGVREVGVVTVWERPTRVIVTALALGGGGALPAASGRWATYGAVAACVLAVAGAIQLTRFLHRALSAPA